MTIDSTFIYYQGGAFGTFFEWCLNYFTDQDFPEELPFLDSTGSAHKFKSGNFIWSATEFDQLRESKLPRFFRAHPGTISDEANKYTTIPKSYDKVLSIELDKLTSVTANGIFLHYTADKSWLWGLNNLIEKGALTSTLSLEQAIALMKEHCLPEDQYPLLLESGVNYLKASLIHSGAAKLSTQWGKSSIHEMDTWELRELLSLYAVGERFDSSDAEIFNTISTKFPNIVVLDILDLRDNFNEVIKKFISLIGLPLVREDKLDEVHQQWLLRQVHKDKDTLVQTIVHSLINNLEFSWTTLTLIDESFLQHYLRMQGYNIKCWNLNEFPTNTKDFLPLLETN